MQQMVSKGMLPKALPKVKPPVCAAYAIGKATRQPWCTKGALSDRTKGTHCTSTWRLHICGPASVHHSWPHCTNERISNERAIFVDQHTSFGFVHLQRTSNTMETLQAKEAFKSYARNHGVIIQHYHAGHYHGDNGCFANKGWINTVRACGQTITFFQLSSCHGQTELSGEPDLAYSVHQCARFLACPKKTHAQAVKRIGRYCIGHYLLATRHEGYNLCPKPHSQEL